MSFVNRRDAAALSAIPTVPDAVARELALAWRAAMLETRQQADDCAIAGNTDEAVWLRGWKLMNQRARFQEWSVDG